MEIGILTFHDADNYGAVLQAYALQEVLKSLVENVEIINYKQPYILKDYKVLMLEKKNLLKSIISNIYYLNTRISKKYKFYAFRKKYMLITKNKYYSSSEIIGKDVFVVGSDQIWNSEITNFDTTFFLDFCSNKARKIAYAASLGKDKISKDDIKIFKENLNNFDSISVREKNSIDILRKYTNKEIFLCLDPTFLACNSIWNKFIYENKIHYDYLLVYRLTDNEEVLKIADIISKKLNLKVLYISNSIRKDSYGFKKIKRVGPNDFLTLFNNASFVVTDSYHGTIFSIIFKKDFITIPHKTRGSRMSSLLQLINLDDRIVTNSNVLNDCFNYKIDYSLTNEILDIERKKSFDFLKQSLGYQEYITKY